MSGAGGATSKEHKALAELINTVPGNEICADCDQRRPTWASVNLGIFICIECSGIHRMMGTHISFVRSTTLDKWDKAQVKYMSTVGNVKANTFWSRKMTAAEKIKADTPMNVRKDFIFAKYSSKKWFGRPEEGPVPGSTSPVVASTGMVVETQLKRRRSKEQLESLNIIKGDSAGSSPSAAVAEHIRRTSLKKPESGNDFDSLFSPKVSTSGSGSGGTDDIMNLFAGTTFHNAASSSSTTSSTSGFNFMNNDTAEPSGFDFLNVNSAPTSSTSASNLYDVFSTPTASSAARKPSPFNGGITGTNGGAFITPPAAPLPASNGSAFGDLLSGTWGPPKPVASAAPPSSSSSFAFMNASPATQPEKSAFDFM